MMPQKEMFQDGRIGPHPTGSCQTGPSLIETDLIGTDQTGPGLTGEVTR